MDKAHPIRHRDTIKQLYQQVENLYTDFISIDHLHDLGIQASQVALGNTGIFDFSPCFFKPQQPGLLDRYPIDLNNKELDIPDLDDRPNWDRCFKRVLASDEGSRVDEETVFDYARLYYERELKLLRPDDSSRRSDETQLYIHCLIEAPRLGTEKRYFTLRHLSSLGALWTFDEKKGDPSTHGFSPITGSLMWRFEGCHGDSKREDPVPHSILTNWVEFEASLADDCLTLYELQSIVRFMVIRSRRKNWEKHKIQPVLLIAYTGLKHGRIIQAHYDYNYNGGKLTLQFSKLFSFEDENTAPIEPFIRYHLSEPVGSTL